MKSEKGEGTIYEKSDEGRVSPKSTFHLPSSTSKMKMPQPNQTVIKKIEVESKAGPAMSTQIIKVQEKNDEQKDKN